MQHAITQYNFITSMVSAWIPTVGMCFVHFLVLSPLSLHWGVWVNAKPLSFYTGLCPAVCHGVHVRDWNAIILVMGFRILCAFVSRGTS